MTKEITYDESSEVFTITLTVPRTMRGKDTYGDGEWEQDAVCVWIDNSVQEYGLWNTQYLDYKDSLQATYPIMYFETQQEALDFAAKYKLMVEFGSDHNHFNKE